VSIAGCKEAEQDAGADIQRYMGDILATLKTFYPAEYDMIEYLAAGEVDSFRDLAKYDAAYVEHLIGYGLVVRRGDDFEFAFDAIAEATKKSLAKEKPSLADRWGEINKRRNRIEEEIRGALYQWAMRLTSTEWNESVRACLTATRFDQVGALTRQEAKQ
jgi:hypothetical protein